MKSHRTIRKWLSDYVDGDLRPTDRFEVESHLTSCKDCVAEVESLRRTLDALKQKSARPSAHRSELYWQQFAARVDKRIVSQEASSETPSSFVGRFLDLVLVNRKPFGFGFASTLTLIALAMGLWSLWIKPHTDREDISAHHERVNPELTAQPAVLEQRTEEYLEQSKVILIGLLNAEADSVAGSSPVLRKQQEISRSLVRESRDLAANLNKPSQQRLKELVSDLGVILVQIANLKSENDVQGIEIVRSGMQQSGILFKINIEELQRATSSSARMQSKGLANPTI